jgi:hypothetical protein
MNRAKVLLVAVLAASAASCSIGAPPGFSSGDSWTFPLVGPLEDGLLVVPVFVNDKGPYLFGIDPDSAVSQVDEAIVSELGLHNGLGPRVLDESDTNRVSRMAEVLSFRIGPLGVRNRNVLVMKVGSMNASGRVLRGMLGRDVISDSIAFGFDRERGVGFLATQKAFTPPANAIEVGYSLVANRVASEFAPVSRRVAKLAIDGKEFKLHLDLGAIPSQLRKKLWDKAGFQSLPIENDLRDEFGTVRHTTEAAVANSVQAGGLSASGMLFVPYEDKRWEDEDVDGTVGLNFFRTMNVSANWDNQKLYLIPRGDIVATAKERIDRWGSEKIRGCEHLGCVSIDLMDQDAPAAPAEPAAPAAPTAPAPTTSTAPGASPSGPPGAGAGAPAIMMPPPRPVVVLRRDSSAAGIDLELLVAAVGANGQVSDLPRLVVNMPGDVDVVTNQLDPSYAGANLVVLDLSPYPRSCSRGNGGCLQSLAPAH